MAGIQELTKASVMDGNDFEIATAKIEDARAVVAMQETKGWKILKAKLETDYENLKHEMLMAEEPEDPVHAKILRSERRAYARAIFLLLDHPEAIVQSGVSAIEDLQIMGFTP